MGRWVLFSSAVVVTKRFACFRTEIVSCVEGDVFKVLEVSVREENRAFQKEISSFASLGNGVVVVREVSFVISCDE